MAIDYLQAYLEQIGRTGSERRRLEFAASAETARLKQRSRENLSNAINQSISSIGEAAQTGIVERYKQQGQQDAETLKTAMKLSWRDLEAIQAGAVLDNDSPDQSTEITAAGEAIHAAMIDPSLNPRQRSEALFSLHDDMQRTLMPRLRARQPSWQETVGKNVFYDDEHEIAWYPGADGTPKPQLYPKKEAGENDAENWRKAQVDLAKSLGRTPTQREIIDYMDVLHGAPEAYGDRLLKRQIEEQAQQSIFAPEPEEAIKLSAKQMLDLRAKNYPTAVEAARAKHTDALEPTDEEINAELDSMVRVISGSMTGQPRLTNGTPPPTAPAPTTTKPIPLPLLPTGQIDYPKVVENQRYITPDGSSYTWNPQLGRWIKG